MSQQLKLVLSVAIVIAIAGSYMFPKVQQVTNQVLGAIPGAILSSPTWEVNGVEEKSLGTRMNGATTTCSWKNDGATSTLTFASFQINTSTSTALVLTLATSTTPNATGTTNLLIQEFPVSSGVKGTWFYKGTSTADTQTGDREMASFDLIGPNVYVTWGVEGSSGFTAANAFGATCKFKAITN